MKVAAEELCEDLLLLLYRVKTAVMQLSEEQGLARTQLFSLYLIYQQDSMGMGQLAEALHCDASNVTGIVDRLVAQDLVVRRENPKDRRTKILQLTAKGTHAVKLLEAALPARLGCDKLSYAEQTALQSVIRRLCA